MTEKRFEVMGINDDQDSCQCCGKRGLKRVVWILDHVSGELKHFGTTCVLAPAKGFDVRVQVQAALEAFKAKESAIYRAAYRIYLQRGGQYHSHPTKPHTWVPADKTLHESIVAEVREMP